MSKILSQICFTRVLKVSLLQVVRRAELLFTEVRNAIRQIAERKNGGLGAGIISSESRFATLEGLLRNEMTEFQVRNPASSACCSFCGIICNTFGEVIKIGKCM